MDKNILLDRLTKKFLRSGFNRNFDQEDFKNILFDSRENITQEKIKFLEECTFALIKVRDTPLIIRQNLALKKLIELGITEEDAKVAIKRIAGMAQESEVQDIVIKPEETPKIIMKEITESEKINQSVQKNHKTIQPDQPKKKTKQKHPPNLLIISPKVVEFPIIELNGENDKVTKVDLTISCANPGEISGKIHSNTPIISISTSRFKIDSLKPVTIQLTLNKKLLTTGGENLIKEAIAIEWTGGIEKVDCRYTVNHKPKNKLWILMGVILFLILILLGNQYINKKMLTPEPIYYNEQVIGMQKEIKIYPKDSWHYTGFDIEPGQTVQISYISGTWASIAHFLDNPFTYPGSGGIFLDVGYNALIGVIGDNPPFPIGEGITFTSNEFGNLYLRINDNDDSDNYGSVIYKIEVFYR